MNKKVVELFATEANETGHYPAVFIHGFPFDHTIWDSLMPFLDSEIRAIFLDLRGFGQSSFPEESCSIEDMANDVASLLDRLGIRTAFLVGHSMGGYVSLAFARLFPDRLSGLGFVSSHAAGDTEEHKSRRYESAAEIEKSGLNQLAHSMSMKLSPDKKHYVDFQKRILNNESKVVANALRAMAERWDEMENLNNISVPTLIISGDKDSFVQEDVVEEMLNRLGRANFVELSGIGHMPMIEAPEETAEAINDFISREVKTR